MSHTVRSNEELYVGGAPMPQRSCPTELAQPSCLSITGWSQSWNLSGKTVTLLEDGSKGLKAFVVTSKLFQEINREEIRGIPERVLADPSKYRAFFDDTYVRANLLSDGQFALMVCPRLRGGADRARPAGGAARAGRQEAPRLDRRVLGLLRDMIPHAKRAFKKNIVALIGPTGTGKSTITNHLLGKEMVFKDAGREGAKDLPERIVVNGEEVAPIGHLLTTSETLYAHTYEIPTHPNLAVVDCGGFYDTRGVAEEVTVVTSVRLTLESAKSVKLAICCDYNIAMMPRAVGLTDLIQTVLERLLADYQASNSVLFLITKPVPNRKGVMPTAVTVVDHIRKIIKELTELGAGPERIAIYKYIIREEGRYVVMYDPLEDRSRREVFSLLQNMPAIENTKSAFNPAYSAHAAVALLEEVVAIAVVGNNLFRNYFNNRQKTTDCSAELLTLEESIDRQRTSIAELGRDNADPETIRQIEERIRGESQAVIQRAEQDIARLQVSVREREAAIVALNERIALMDREGEEVTAYWHDGIDQEGINIESVTTVTETWEKSGFFIFGGSSGSNTKTTKTYDKRAISRDFAYRGPEIDHIVKNPADGSCWTNENQDATSYSVHYETGKGEAANARIEIFVKKKFLPEEIHKGLGLVQEKATENANIYDLGRQIGEHEGRMHAARLALNDSGNKIERLAEYQRSLESLQASSQRLQERRQTLEREKTQLVVSIVENADDFTFLEDYLSLSHDRTLEGKETVQEFRRLNQQYQMEHAHE